MKIKAEIKRHADTDPSVEVCGLIVDNPAPGSNGPIVLPVKNIAPNPWENFELNPREVGRVMSQNTVLGYYHSHTADYDHMFSQGDVVRSQMNGYPVYLYSHLTGKFNRFGPAFKHNEKISRFIPGVFDCFTTVQDYLSAECGLAIPWPEYTRQSMATGLDGWEEYHEMAGMVEIVGRDPDQLERGDILEMCLGARRRPGVVNHVRVYIGNGRVVERTIDGAYRENDYRPLDEDLIRIVRVVKTHENSNSFTRAVGKTAGPGEVCVGGVVCV